MTAKLHISPTLALPLDALTQTFAFLARRGAGKTYTAGKLVEEMLDAGGQVVVLDPVGNWYGLRLSADGKGKGIPIPVFGGEHGDLPLEPGAGALIADLVVDRGISAVLDLSTFRKGQRKEFVTAFAEQLFHRKKTSRSPLHLVFEEAQVFVPQKTFGDEARMLGAMEDLVKLGRNYGIGASLISQRPQAVNKDVLNQTEALFVLQTTGPQERKVIEGWIVDKGLSVTKAVDDLPSLPRGTAYVWSPQWLGIFEKVKIGTKRTYDASATPTFGAMAESTRELAPVDLEQIRVAMKDTIAKAEENDPRALRRQVVALRAELAKKTTAAPPLLAAKTVRVEVPMLREQDIARLAKIADHAAQAGENLLAEAGRIRASIAAARQPVATPAAPSAVRPAPVQRPAAPARASAPRSGDLPRGEAAVLTALIRYHPSGLRRQQLTVLTGYKRSTRDAYIQRLNEANLVDTTGERVTATAEGLAALGDVGPLPTGQALQAFWTARLPEGERAILEHLISLHPHAIDRDKLSEATGYKRSTRDAYIQRLAAKELVTEPGRGIMRASDSLFDGGIA